MQNEAQQLCKCGKDLAACGACGAGWAQALQPSGRPPKTSVVSVLTALDERDRERAEDSKVRARATRAAKRDAKKEAVEAPGAAKKDAKKEDVEAPQEAPKKRKGGDENAHENEEAPTKRVASQKSAKAKDENTSNASYAIERSRSQVMCRTGLRGPGQTKAIKYGPGTPHPTEKSAAKEAKKWVEKAMKDRR